MKSCKDCGSELLYLFEFNEIALFGCTLCKRVYFIEVTKIDMNKYKQVTISNLVEKAISGYIKKKIKDNLRFKVYTLPKSIYMYKCIHYIGDTKNGL